MPADSSHNHAALETLHFSDGILLWGGRKVTELATEVGQTPFYAYDRGRMTTRVEELRAVMPEGISLHYAMKANPMPDVVRHFVGLVDGIDVASAGELEIALSAGADTGHVSFAGPGKRDEELAAAIQAGITINLESETEMRRAADVGAGIGRRPFVALRVNPPFELKTAGMKMGGRPSQFGIDAERIPAALAELATLDLEFRGFHVFSGSQNLRAEAIVESLEKTTELVLELSAACSTPPSFVNLGGGLGIPYFPRERPIDLAAVAPAADAAVRRLTQGIGPVEVIMELGRYLVGEAGIYVCRVIDIKESRGAKFAVCDGGLHHHLAASGNFGQVIRKNYPVVAVERSDEEEIMSVVGPLCTPLDLLADRMPLSHLEVGSLVAVLQSGAYGATASPGRFLSHPEYVEIFV
jgi:diaminopimelate decarboxylase